MNVTKIRPKQINEIKSYERADFIKHELFQHINSLSTAIDNAQLTLKTIYKLKDIGSISGLIQAIEQNASIKGLSKAGAIIFNNGQNNIVLHSSTNGLECKEQNPNNGQTLKRVLIKDRALVEKGGKIETMADAETFLEDALNQIDFPLLKLKIMLNKPENQALIDKFKFAPAHIRIKRDSLNILNQQTVADIKNLYAEIFNNLAQITVPATHSKVKNGYPGINHGLKATRMLDFARAGALKHGFKINIVRDHNIRPLVLQFRQEDGSFRNMIINPDNTVHKSKALRSISDTGNNAVVYSKEELESPEVRENLLAVKQELQNYNDYILNEIKTRNQTKERLSTTEVGTINSYNMRLVNLVYKKYMECKNELAKLNADFGKKHAKEAFNIECSKGSPSMILKNVTPQNDDLHISFPTILNGRFTKIIAFKDDVIKKTWFMQGNKLIKFEAKSLGISKRKDNKFHYYSNEEIKNSGLREHLEILAKRLSLIAQGLKNKQY